MAGVFAVAVAVLLPFGFYAVGHGALEAATQIEADLKSEIINPFISANPDLWRFSSDQLTGIVQGSSYASGAAIVRVFDGRGEEVVKVGERLAAPSMVRSAPLFDAGVPAGRLEVGRSLRPLLYKTLAMAVASALIAAALFMTFRLAPMDALSRALQELAREKERAEAMLHSIGDGVISTDVRGRIDYANPAALLIAGCAPDALIGKGLADVLVPVDAQAREYRLLGTAIHATASPIRDAQGDVAGGVLVFRKRA